VYFFRSRPSRSPFTNHRRALVLTDNVTLLTRFVRVSTRTCNAYSPWVNNCIGYGNHREFILLLFYLTLGCAYGCCLLGPIFVEMMSRRIEAHGFRMTGAVHGTGLLDLPPPWSLWAEYRSTGRIDDDVVLRAAFPFMLGIGATVACLLATHVRLIGSGLTTVERLSRPTEGSRNPFDMGPGRNWRRVMGPNVLICAVPFPLLRPHARRRWGESYGRMSKDR
jgi:hypothetical protein